MNLREKINHYHEMIEALKQEKNFHMSQRNWDAVRDRTQKIKLLNEAIASIQYKLVSMG